jgi:hypothetical protein
LTPHIDAYTAALNQGWHIERKFLKTVCNEFHARVSWRLPDHEEPVLEDWDPAATRAVVGGGRETKARAN